MSLSLLRSELKKAASPTTALMSARFFKTGEGHYGEGDIFLGIKVPHTRAITSKYIDISLQDIESLLKSKIHEERLASLFILVQQYNKYPQKRKEIFDFYLKNARFVNNWDLVDSSADKIVGPFLFDKDRKILQKLAISDSIWERRISIISTYHFIRNKQFEDTIKIALVLMRDKQDLIHKAVGWMLREMGKRDVAVLEEFLRKHCKVMPRTMLRYSIEKFPIKKRKAYMDGKV